MPGMQYKDYQIFTSITQQQFTWTKAFPFSWLTPLTGIWSPQVCSICSLCFEWRALSKLSFLTSWINLVQPPQFCYKITTQTFVLMRTSNLWLVISILHSLPVYGIKIIMSVGDTDILRTHWTNSSLSSMKSHNIIKTSPSSLKPLRTISSDQSSLQCLSHRAQSWLLI